MFKKILKWTGLILFFIIVGLVIIVSLNQNKKFDAAYPSIKASKDSAVLARGKYLVYGEVLCPPPVLHSQPVCRYMTMFLHYLLYEAYAVLMVDQ